MVQKRKIDNKKAWTITSYTHSKVSPNTAQSYTKIAHACITDVSINLDSRLFHLIWRFYECGISVNALIIICL